MSLNTVLEMSRHDHDTGSMAQHINVPLQVTDLAAI